MNIEAAQAAAFTETEKAAEKYINHMLGIYDSASKDIVAQLESLYAKYLGTVDPKDYYNIVIQHDRLTNLLYSVQVAYNKYAKAAGKETQNIVASGMAGVFYRQRYALQWVEPMLNFSILDPRLIDLSVTGTAEAWKEITASLTQRYGDMIQYQPQYGTLSDLLATNRLDDLAKINQTITSGIIQGYSLPKVTQKLMDAMNTSKYKAERIARTEFNRTMNAGAYAQQKDAQAQGIEFRRKWLATLDTHTRPVHAALDGQETGIDEPFHSQDGDVMFPGRFSSVGQNINCRCQVVTVRPGAELQGRTARNPVTGKSEYIDYKDFNTWSKENGLVYNKKSGSWEPGE